MFSGKKEYFLHGSLIPFQNPLFAQFTALWGVGNCMEALTLNGINILVLASALRTGVLKKVDKTYMTLKLCGIFVFHCLHALAIIYFRKVLRAYWTPVFSLLLAPSLHQSSLLSLTAKVLFLFSSSVPS